MFFEKKKQTSTVVFDVGTASVSATLFHYENGKPAVEKTFRRFYKTMLSHDSERFSKAMVGHFAEVLKDVRDFIKGSGMPAEYMVGFSSIFYLGKTEHLEESWTSSKYIAHTDVDRLVQSGEQKFLTDLGRENVILFEKMIMKTRVNGYDVENPAGKEGSSLEVWVRYTVTSADLYRQILNIIKSFRHDAAIHFATFPLAAFTIVREFLFPDYTGLLVDIGGEVTEITFLRDGVVVETVSLPFGVFNILVRISDVERVDLAGAQALLEGYTKGTLNPETTRRVRDSIKKEMKAWEEIFERVWQRASRLMMSNVKMFFLGGGALVREMKDAVTPPLLHPELARGLQSSVILPDAFRDQFAVYNSFDGPADFGLLSLILKETHNV